MYEVTGLDKIPPYMHAAVCRYILHGLPVGHFLTAIFSDQLVESFSRADSQNLAAMHAWVNFIYNEMPSASHGSPEKVRAWQAHGGMDGVDAP